MKKMIVVFMLVALLVPMFALSANAAESTGLDPLVVEFENTLNPLIRGEVYNAHYIAMNVSSHFVCQQPFGPKAVPEAEFESYMNTYYAYDDALLNTIRNDMSGVVEYDATAKTYTAMGFLAGSLDIPQMHYLGYVKRGEQYDVYFRDVVNAWLDAPEDVEWVEFFNTYYDSVTDRLTYQGVSYQQSMDGWYTVKDYLDTGKKFTLEKNGDVIRIVSCVNYAAGELPAKFDDKPIIHQLPDSGVTISKEATCFPGGTTVQVEAVQSGNVLVTVQNAMKPVAEKYAAYEFTATKDGVAVQPDGTLEVTFIIPESFSENVSVYYMAPDGTLELLNAWVRGSRVIVSLTHFSTYILVDNDSKPVIAPPTQEQPSQPETTEPAPTQPEVTEPEATQPEATQPEATQPEATEPEVTEPEATQPETTVPQRQESQETQPANEQTEESRENNGGKPGVWVTVIVIAVIAAGAGVFLFLRKKRTI